VLLGSNDNINWILLDNRNIISIPYKISNNNAYLYYRLVFKSYRDINYNNVLRINNLLLHIPVRLYLSDFGNVELSTSDIIQYGSMTNFNIRSFPNNYNVITGIYNGINNINTIDIAGNIHYGIWIQIKYETPTIIKSYSFEKYDTDTPNEWVLLSSNNEINWNLLDNRTDNTTNITSRFNISNNTEYQYYRIVFKKVTGIRLQSTLNLNNIIFYKNILTGV
jgi:hypothetical protein